MYIYILVHIYIICIYSFTYTHRCKLRWITSISFHLPWQLPSADSSKSWNHDHRHHHHHQVLPSLSTFHLFQSCFLDPPLPAHWSQTARQKTIHTWSWKLTFWTLAVEQVLACFVPVLLGMMIVPIIVGMRGMRWNRQPVILSYYTI